MSSLAAGRIHEQACGLSQEGEHALFVALVAYAGERKQTHALGDAARRGRTLTRPIVTLGRPGHGEVDPASAGRRFESGCVVRPEPHRGGSAAGMTGHPRRDPVREGHLSGASLRECTERAPDRAPLAARHRDGEGLEWRAGGSFAALEEVAVGHALPEQTPEDLQRPEGQVTQLRQPHELQPRRERLGRRRWTEDVSLEGPSLMGGIRELDLEQQGLDGAAPRLPCVAPGDLGGVGVRGAQDPSAGGGTPLREREDRPVTGLPGSGDPEAMGGILDVHDVVALGQRVHRGDARRDAPEVVVRDDRPGLGPEPMLCVLEVQREVRQSDLREDRASPSPPRTPISRSASTSAVRAYVVAT